MPRATSFTGRPAVPGAPSPASRTLTWVLKLSLMASTFGAGQIAPASADGSPRPPVAAAAAGTGAEAATKAPSAAYLLAPGDKVTITVFDQTEISGSYLVEPTGTINLPLIGPLLVTSFTPEDLQRELVAQFSNGYLQNPVISVRLGELRPFTIVGAVRAPGRYSYVDGMTVETAMALAGGIAVLANEGVAQRSDFLQTDERLKALKLGYLSQIARKARLDAQLAGNATIAMPAADPADAEMMEHLVAGERDILTFEATSQERQKALLTEQARQVESDIAAFTEQAALENEQIDFLDDQIKDLRGLLVNGLTRKSAVLDLQREKSKSRSDLSRILSDLSRSKSLLGESKLKLQEIDTAYRSRLMTDLQQTKLKIAESEGGLPLINEARALKLAQMPLELRSAGGPVALRISRYSGGAIQAIAADPATPLWPGDILQVGSGSSSGGGGAPAAPNGLRLPAPGADASANVPEGPLPAHVSQR